MSSVHRERRRTDARARGGCKMTEVAQGELRFSAQEAVQRKKTISLSTSSSLLAKRYFGRMSKRTKTEEAYFLRLAADCFVGTGYDAVV